MRGLEVTVREVSSQFQIPLNMVGCFLGYTSSLKLDGDTE